MNQNLGLTGCDETANDILEHIPSDSERRAATDGESSIRRGAGGYFRRPASFRIFRRVEGSSYDGSSSHYDDDRSSAGDISVDTNLRTVMMLQSAGEDPEERKISAIDEKKKEGDIYNISADDDINPLSNDYIGVVANYFSVGLMIGGSTSLLYPVLIVKAGATASLMTAVSERYRNSSTNCDRAFGCRTLTLLSYLMKLYSHMLWSWCFGVTKSYSDFSQIAFLYLGTRENRI